jgi:hypothetical protein
MKKYIFVSLLLALILVTPVLAETSTADLIAQLRAQIATLTAQLNQLLAERNQNGFCYDFGRNLKLGDKDETEGDIAILGRVLNLDDDAVYLGFDKVMFETVKKFQAKYGIPSTGYVGPLTRAKLNSLYGCKNKVFITPSALGNAKVKEGYDQQLNQHGLVGNITWKIVGGQLPSGLSLYAGAGSCELNGGCPQSQQDWASIGGYPTTAGTYTFTVQATNGTQTATQNYTLVVKGKDSDSGAPVISGISGPTSLKVGETGTWVIKASDPRNGILWYYINWGDRQIIDEGGLSTSRPPSDFVQTSTFTHSYNQVGIYTVTFSVMNSANTRTQSTMTVNVTNSTQSPITVLSPNGGEKWETYDTKNIKWKWDEVKSTDKVDLYLDPEAPACTRANPPCMLFMAIHAPYLLDKKIAANASYNWVVATDIDNKLIPAGQYRVRVCQAGTQTCDSSDNYFTIASPTHLMQVCPDKKIINKMPVVGGIDTTTSTYFTMNGTRWELEHFDLDWVTRNCSVKEETVY